MTRNLDRSVATVADRIRYAMNTFNLRYTDAYVRVSGLYQHHTGERLHLNGSDMDILNALFDSDDEPVMVGDDHVDGVEPESWTENEIDDETY